jgi:ribosome modulation factor
MSIKILNSTLRDSSKMDHLEDHIDRLNELLRKGSHAGSNLRSSEECSWTHSVESSTSSLCAKIWGLFKPNITLMGLKLLSLGMLVAFPKIYD